MGPEQVAYKHHVHYAEMAVMIVIVAVYLLIAADLYLRLVTVCFLYVNGCQFLGLPGRRLGGQRKSLDRIVSVFVDRDVIHLAVLVQV